MPEGMFLRSNWTATQISDPKVSWTLEAYQASTRVHFSQPVPLANFVSYGEWYQHNAVPDLDTRSAVRVDTVPEGFRVDLTDGEVFKSRRVVIAAGIAAFAWRPSLFSALPFALSSHTSEHSSFAEFRGKQVLVIGGGQSALECAALLHENGASPEVITRRKTIHWLGGWASRTLHGGLGELTNQLLYAPTDVGPAGISQLVARPDWFRRLPRSLQIKLWRRSVRPAGARWLVERLSEVPIRLARYAVAVRAVGERVIVRLNDSTERNVDHVLLGTGYRVDISRYDFLSREIVNSMSRANGFPRLKKGLETSIPGLHILGAPAAWSFGPLMQFVSGARYASRALARVIAPGHTFSGDLKECE